MSPWPFVIGAYAVTAIVVVIEIIALRLRHRAAVAASNDDADPGEDALHDDPFASKVS